MIKDASSKPATRRTTQSAGASSGKRWMTALLMGGVGLCAMAGVRLARHMLAVSHELRSPLLLLPLTLSKWTTPLFRRIQDSLTTAGIPEGVRVSERLIDSFEGDRSVRLVIFERMISSGRRSALLWMHGGGFVAGSPEQDMALVARILARLDVVIVSVDYALLPDHPFPAPLDDCHTALTWLAQNTRDWNIDPDRIAIGGQSAGGGLAAALVHKAIDQGPINPIFQLLVYPMLDARTPLRPDDRGTGQFIWNRQSNHYAWQSYLGHPVHVDPAPYAVPAARSDLGAVPPTWIGVGTLDLFFDEDVAYGRRLSDAGVPCDVYTVEAAYHGFDILKPDAVATTAFYHAMLDALDRGLSGG